MTVDVTFFSLAIIFTAHKRSLRRLCFHRCLSVHGGSLSRGSLSKGGLCQGKPSLYGYVRAVRILLEWILVTSVSVNAVNYKELPDTVKQRFNSHLNFASRHQSLDQMPKAMVLQFPCFGRLVSICTLGKTSKCWLGFRPICLWISHIETTI